MKELLPRPEPPATIMLNGVVTSLGFSFGFSLGLTRGEAAAGVGVVEVEAAEKSAGANAVRALKQLRESFYI